MNEGGFPMRSVLLPALVCISLGCSRDDGIRTIRIIDEFDPNLVHGAPVSKTPAPQLFWNFSQPGNSNISLLGWKVGSGVAGLKVVDGKLTGRTTTSTPIIYVPRPETADEEDLVHSLEVKARTAAQYTLLLVYAFVRPT